MLALLTGPCVPAAPAAARPYGGAVRDLTVADDVAALVGAEDLRQLAAGVGPTGVSECVTCRAGIDADAAASVVAVTVGPLVTVARLAHRGCSPSGVVELPVDELGLTPEQLAALVAGDVSDATARALLLPHAAGGRPCLLVELHGGLATPADEGERVDLVVSGLLRRGLHLHARLGHLPPAAPGWRVDLGTGTARIGQPDGGALYEGTLSLPSAWADGVAGLGGRCVLLTGTIRRGADTGLVTALQSAARDGTLVAGLVDVAG